MKHGNFLGPSNDLVEKWEPILEGIEDPWVRKVTAQIYENQAKVIYHESQINEEALTPAATTVGQLGTYQKFAFPLIRRVYPELIANKIVAVQPMAGPVSQIFYLGHSRAGNLGGTYGEQVVYSQHNLTYRGGAPSAIGSLELNQVSGAGYGTGAMGFISVSAGLDGDDAQDGFDTSSLLHNRAGSPSATYGGQIASFPDPKTTLGWHVSAGERLRTSGIPEISFHIEQQAVVARTKKMRALWTIEASQDLKAYHSLELERELTDLLSKEISLEIDRELIEDLRMIAYGYTGDIGLGNWDPATLTNGNPNNFGVLGGTSPNVTSEATGPAAWNYDFGSALSNSTSTSGSNIFVHDWTSSAVTFAPQHMGHVYANLLALVNFASQDIYKSTQRGPGTILITSPLMSTYLESAAKLEGGMAPNDGPTNNKRKIEYRGKLAGKYDLYIDPLYPSDEMIVGYKGDGPMDAGFVYAPYVPIMSLPTITDPESLQPRKGIMTRYGKVGITPVSRFYRVIRIVGPNSNYLFTPFARNTTINGSAATAY